MPARTKIVYTLITVAIIIFVPAFLFLDLRAATSRTNVDSQVNSHSIGEPKIELASGLHIYVEGKDDFASRLRAVLTEKFREDKIKTLNSESLEAKYDGQVLAVAILNRSVSYNPFYPSASLGVLFTYSSSGNTTYFNTLKSGKSTVANLSTDKSGEGELLIEGRLNLTDNTNGIISLKAYQKHLAEEIASNIIQKLASARRVLGTAMAKGINIVIPVGLEKMMPTPISKAASEAGIERMDYSMGMPVGLLPLNGTVVDEIKAFQILTGAEAIPIGAGGVNGAEGAVTLVIKGSDSRVKKSLQTVDSVKGAEEPLVEPPDCRDCRYPRCSLGARA